VRGLFLAGWLALAGSASAQTLRCEGLEDLTLVNGDAVIKTLPLGEIAEGFQTGSPYPVTGQGQLPVVQGWWPGRYRVQTVCGVLIEGDSYRLKTFGFPDTALEQGAIITHRQHCGTCSSLQDLSVYIDTPDLTDPARDCARKGSLAETAACMEALGFTRPCAETWAYNARHTRELCARTCRKTYGMVAILTGRMDQTPNNLPDGSLNACLACDETHSGPGFQFAAGRTRRGSGIQSAIQRPKDEVYKVDHGQLPGCRLEL
jgi:hypothetical protein